MFKAKGSDEPVNRRLLFGGIPALNAAKTRCPQGHPYSRQNTYLNQGKRYCRTCHRRHALAHQARKAKR